MSFLPENCNAPNIILSEIVYEKYLCTLKHKFAHLTSRMLQHLPWRFADHREPDIRNIR